MAGIIRSKADIVRLLAKIDKAREDHQESNETGLAFCPICEDWCVEYVDYKDGDYTETRIDCTDEHYSYLLYEDYEATSLRGFESALMWMIGELNEY